MAATRTLGNHWLKSAKLAIHNFDSEAGYKVSMAKFRKAYVSGEPEITVVELSAQDKWLILATDGMWNHTKRKEVPSIIGNDTDDSFKVVTK